MKRFESLLIALGVSALVAACSSTPVPSGQQAATVEEASPAQDANDRPVRPSAVASVMLPPHKDPNSLISKERSVYFNYDDFSIPGQYNVLIERHGKYLQSHPGLAVRVEGNADERGSAEYNLALGQKRAEAVRKAILAIKGHKGLEGTYEFDARGDGVHGYNVVKNESGKVVFIKRVDFPVE